MTSWAIHSLLTTLAWTLVRSHHVEVKSHRVTSQADMVDSSSRHKRALFSIQDEQALVDQHNDLRRQIVASDMEFMTRHSELTSMAEDWAKLCIWEHGQPQRASLPFKDIGQNLYAYNGTFDAHRGVQLWFDEYQYYDYNTGACSKEPCGHYTQVVWSTSRAVGCAYAFCPSMAKIDLTNGVYLVCNYGPAGNWRGEKPYKIGNACTQCKSGQFWCDDGLCKESCSPQNTKCECRASCQNCGTQISSDCSCKCQRGWTGPNCAEVCQDNHEYCGANPGWPKYLCNTTSVRERCLALCDVCQVQSGTPVTCASTPTTPPPPRPTMSNRPPLSVNPNEMLPDGPTGRSPTAGPSVAIVTALGLCGRLVHWTR